MGNLAVCLKRLGVEVGGSDGCLYPPLSDLLAENGISAIDSSNVEVMSDWSGSTFIVGNAVSRGHPQVEWLMNRPAERRFSFPGFLGEFLLRLTANLVVIGTHGKSTTTAAAAYLLAKLDETAGWFVGGVLSDHSPAFSWSSAVRSFVIEGDEYDSAFFDKRSKFVHYRPRVLLVNNLEFDHADIFRDTADVQRSFRQVFSLVPGAGSILYNGDDPRLREILPVPWTQCLSFGMGEDNDYRLSRRAEDGSSVITIQRKGEDKPLIHLRSALLGEFNARNLAGAVLGVRHLVGPVLPGEWDFSDFQGLKRRQEILFQSPTQILIEDFGHHPTALGESLRALRERFPGWSLHAMVEPRSNTLRTNRLQAELIRALGAADRVTIAPIYRAEKIPREKRLDAPTVAKTLADSGVPCQFSQSFEEVHQSFLNQLAHPQTLTVVFSNGAFGGLLENFTAALSSASRP